MIEQKKITPEKASIPTHLDSAKKEEKTNKNLRYMRDKERKKVKSIFKFY